VAYWESGESKINAEDRKVLLALIKVLYTCGGMKSSTEANRFLELGNYRSLNTKETETIFLKENVIKSGNPSVPENPFAIFAKEFKTLIAKVREGPKPLWPRLLAALMRKAADQFSISTKTILWAWAWLISWWLIAPSLRLPITNQAETFSVMLKYGAGSLIVPLWIGLLVDTKANEYWKEQPKVNHVLLRLYTYQGAGIGFNLGYFFIFPASLARYYLQMDPSIWIEILAVTIGLILGNMGAHVVPHNLWLAYGRLKLSDGGIFFVVALIGPLWAFFFLEFSSILLTPLTGVLVMLSALSLAIIITTRQYKRKRYDNEL
jgi:hypothetical protein